MRLLFALALGLLALLLVALLLWVRPLWAGTTRCLTSEEKIMQRLQTLCDDGTRGISTYNKTLERWDTTLTKGRKPVCTVRMDPTTKQMRVRCR
jgi:hypothetical protein